MMQKITDLTEPPVVGELYLVPCVRTCAANFWTRRYVPILGEFHWDKEIIKFPEEHVHIDFRFLNNHEFDRINNNALFGRVINKLLVEVDRWEERRCNRKMPKFPGCNDIDIPWMKDLENAYKDKQVICGRCPHKGINLNLIDSDRDGNKVCPAHGLKWDKDGKLIVRYQ